MVNHLESGLAPQSQKKFPNLAQETSCPRWQTRAHTVQTPTPSTILHVWQWYQCWFMNSRWVTVNVHSLYRSIASSSLNKKYILICNRLVWKAVKLRVNIWSSGFGCVDVQNHLNEQTKVLIPRKNNVITFYIYDLTSTYNLTILEHIVIHVGEFL